jgi:hypothetical protein
MLENLKVQDALEEAKVARRPIIRYIQVRFRCELDAGGYSWLSCSLAFSSSTMKVWLESCLMPMRRSSKPFSYTTK